MVIDGVKIEFEQETETNQWFAHIWLLDGKIFGKAKVLREYIPIGTWITVPPSLQPSITWLLQKCGFQWVTRLPVNGLWNDVLQKVE